MRRQLIKALAETKGLVTRPDRIAQTLGVVLSDGWRYGRSDRHLYRYSTTREPTPEVLHRVMEWIRAAQRPDGGNAAYYSLVGGYSASYPETTGYLIPTVYDYGELCDSRWAPEVARQMEEWLLGLQLPSGAFPGGLAGAGSGPSVFNTGQILNGLVAALERTGRTEVHDAARRAGDWLVEVQAPDGRWEGPTYQGRAHSYYTMVAWALALLHRATGEGRYREAALANAEWAMSQQDETGWYEGVNLPGRPTFLHFVAYIIQGLLETGILLEHAPAMESARRAAWKLLRKFEVTKHLAGAYERGWKPGGRFVCVTGNAQVACVWLQLYRVTRDLRFLNAGLKMNELIKEHIPSRAPNGIRGGVPGSFPTWGLYQPFHYINWGAKFTADAFMDEIRLVGHLEQVQA